MSLADRNYTPQQAEFVSLLREFAAGAVLFNQRVAERVGLHATDLQCANLLYLQGPSTPGRLAEYTGLTTGGVTVMLDRLEKAGYIKRVANPDDRRSVLVRVSAKKMEKLDEHYAGVSAQLEAFLKSVSEAELAVALKFFRHINAIRISAAMGEPR